MSATKCRRTVCINDAAECVHVDTGERYCYFCAEAINKANGKQLIVSLPILAGMYRDQQYRIEELTSLLAVLDTLWPKGSESYQKAELIRAYLEMKAERDSLLAVARVIEDFKNRQEARSMPWPIDVFKALEAAKQIPSIKAEIEK